MTIATETRKTGPLPCNGVTTQFNYLFKIYNADDILVTHLDVLGVESTLTKVATAPAAGQYTVSGIGVSAGGFITTGSTYATGESITMSLNLALLQPRGFSNTGGYRGETHELAYDELTQMILQLRENLDRVLAFSVASTSSGTLPALGDGDMLVFDLATNKFLAMRNIGSGAFTVSPYIETLLDDLNAATARATLELQNGALLKHNDVATVAPTVNDDSTLGYGVNSTWTNVTSDLLYVCLDASVGAAVWAQMAKINDIPPHPLAFV